MGSIEESIARRSHIRKAGLAVGFLALLFFMFWARAFYGSMKTYRLGETALKKHEYIKAVTFFDRSLRWYTPFNPYVERSAERLWEIGTRAEEKDDTRLALIAMGTIRRGFLAARSFYTPGKDWIRKCDAEINKLTGPGRHSQLPEGVPQHQPAAEPNPLWSMVVSLSFLGWVGSMIGLIVFAFKGHGKLRVSPGRASLWGGLALICFALWLIGMMKA